jgi:pimeloyl-ACP methyl ester carboxylesterase
VAPTLLVSGRDDNYGTYANAAYTAPRIANARFIGFERGGHMLVGHAQETREAILAHLRGRRLPP